MNTPPRPPVPNPEDDRVNRTAGEFWRWCPVCGHELHNQQCKLRCPRCHYFMSCSDFDMEREA